ncbi:MAG: autotransporter outer membrane beta-barrel domain-containing protein [Alphaproteobacteria bacterium]|nr:autotransporter outer membrane beta-barrel domain-containing protein [Alphaproteobacteria bacterium]
MLGGTLFFLHLYFSILTAQLGDSLFMAENMGAFDTTASCHREAAETVEKPAPCRRRAYFAAGSFGGGQSGDMDSNLGSGMLGFSNKITDDIMLGLALSGAKSHEGLDPGGSVSGMTSRGASLLAAYTPSASGLRLFATGQVADLDLRETHYYDNGGGLEASHGETGAVAYGLAAQAGWEFQGPPRHRLMPYADYRWSMARAHAFREPDGSAPADYRGRNIASSEVRLGLQDKFSLSDEVILSGRIAWGHRLDDGKNKFFDSAGNLIQDIGLDAGKRDWAEAAIGANWRVVEGVQLQSRLSAHTGDTGNPAAAVTLGAALSF